MNILPKKSWHVRNKDNIERVRKDEENAANEEKERLRRVALAESEARTEQLRSKARKRCHDDVDDSEVTAIESSSSNRHINFFEELEQGRKVGGKNVEHEEEKRKEKEAQEKAIGLLTYLGQGSVELQESKPWYYKPPDRLKTSSTASSSATESAQRDEVDMKRKKHLDPMCSMDKYVSVSKKVHSIREGGDKAVKTHKPESRPAAAPLGPAVPKSIEQLRAERLKREQQERQREQQLIGKLSGSAPSAPEPVSDERQMRYNSQFNPDFVRRPRDKQTSGRDYSLQS